MTTIFTQSAATVYAPVNGDGTPRAPNNAEAQRFHVEVERLIEAVIAAGGKLYTSKSSLDADLVPGANTPAIVLGDATVGNNGLYMKVGATTTGSWTRVGDVPGYSAIAASNAGAGSANAIVATTDIPIPSADRGALIVLNITHVNTAATTVAFNGGTALALKTNTGVDVLPGTLTVGLLVAGYKIGSTFQLISDVNSAQYIAAAIDVMTTVLDPQFATVAAAELYDPDVAPSYIRTAGYTAAGTGGATYALVVSEPSHDGKIQIAEGSWYELASQRPDPLELGAAGGGVIDDTAKLVSTLGIGRPVSVSTKHLADTDSLVLAGDGQSIAGAFPAQAVAAYPGARIVTNDTSGKLLEVTGHGCVIHDVHLEALSGKVANTGIHAQRPSGNADDLDLQVIRGSVSGLTVGAQIIGRSPNFEGTTFAGNTNCIDWQWPPGGTDGELPTQGLPLGMRRGRFINCFQHGGGRFLRISENANFRPLPYDGQSGQFTVGQVVTGATSGATGTIVEDDDQGTAGCLYLSGVTGTYVDGEALSDPVTGAASANLPGGFEVWARFQIANFISDINNGGLFSGSCAYGESSDCHIEQANVNVYNFARRSRYKSTGDVVLGTAGDTALSPSNIVTAAAGLFESSFTGFIFGHTDSSTFVFLGDSRDVVIRGVCKDWGMDMGANRAAVTLSTGPFSNFDIDLTLQPGAGSVHCVYGQLDAVISNSRIRAIGHEALGEVIDPTGAWIDGGGNDFQFSGTKSTENELDNGDFQIWQRGPGPFTSATTPANNDATFLADRWRSLSDGNDTVDVSRTTSVVPTGSRTAIVFDVETANKKFGILQMLTNERSVDLIGWNLALQLKARIGGSNATLDLIRAAIVVWSGTADAPDADPISAWGAEGTNPTLKTNWAFIGTPGSLAQLTTSYQTFRLRGKPTSGNNIGILIWVDNADATVADLLYIGDVQLERGLCCTPYKQRRYHDDKRRCEYHYKRVTSPEDNATIAVGYIATTSVGNFLLTAFAGMWGAPQTTAAVGYLNLEMAGSSTVSAVTALGLDSLSEVGVSVQATGTGTPYTANDGAVLRIDSGGYIELSREI